MVEEKDEASTRNDAVVVVLVLWGRRGRHREAILGRACVVFVRDLLVMLLMRLWNVVGGKRGEDWCR